jgi:membrane fusion protein (multidrug efflux system)
LLKHQFFPFAALMGACAVALSACGQAEPKQAPKPLPRVEFVAVAESRLPLDETLAGTTEAYAVADVRPQVSGQLVEQLFAEGNAVDAGQPLFQIDRASYQAAYDGASAVLQNAQDTLTLAEAKAKRYAELYKQFAISKQDNDGAQSAYKQAATVVAQQKANLEKAELDLNNTLIRAPISGYIGRSLISRGALVTAYQSNPLAVVETINPIYVDVGVLPGLLASLKEKLAESSRKGKSAPASHVILKFEDGTRYPLEGKLSFANVAFDKVTGRVVLRAVFPNPRLALGPGMKVSLVYSDGSEERAILVPKAGIHDTADGRATALVLDGRDVVRERAVTLGAPIGAMARVTAGLDAGDRLVVSAPQTVHAGMQVRAANDPLPAS